MYKSFNSYNMEPQLYRPYGTGTSLYNIQWNLSYTDPMGLALVYNIQWNLSYTDPMGLALVCIMYSGTSVTQTLWDLSYTDPMGLALVCIMYSGTSVI